MTGPRGSAVFSPLPALPRTLPALTGLRIGAALLVVVSHFTSLWRPGFFPGGAGNPMVRLLEHVVLGITGGADAAVSFFFVLSGFILTYNYFQNDSTIRGGARAFYVARIARIYPSYLVAFLLAALPFYWANGLHVHGVITAAAALTLVQSWSPHLATAWNDPAWSLSDEAFFYLVFPLAAIRFVLLPSRRLRAAALVLWLIVLAIPTLYMTASWTGLLHYPAELGLVTLNPLVRVPEFLLGVITGHLFRLSYVSDGPGTWRPAHPALLAAMALIVLTVLLVIVYAFPTPFRHNGILAPLWLVLIYALAWNKGRLAAFLSLPLMTLLGEASYSIYLFHWPIWDLMRHVIAVPAATDPACKLFFALYLGVTVSLAVLSFYLIETPARRIIRRAFGRRYAPGDAGPVLPIGGEHAASPAATTTI